MRRGKLLQRILLACCLLPTALCVLAFAQGGTGKLPPIRKLPPPIRNPPPRVNPTPSLPDLKISERRVTDITVLDLNGKITAREGGSLLRNAIRRLVKDGKKKILLNLAKVSSIDEAEAKQLNSTYFSLRTDGGQLKLCSPSTKVRDQLVKGLGGAAVLDTLMRDVFEKEQEALARFS